MRAGELRHRITIQTQASDVDTFGEVTGSWSTHVTAWASVEPLSGRELIEGRQLSAAVTHRIRMRHQAGIEPQMRVSWDSRIFQIEAILNTKEIDREIVLLCTEIVS